MSPPVADPLIPELTQRPTSLFLQGSNRPLLNWVLYAIVVRSDPNFHWTDLRRPNDVVDPLDPLAQHIIPEDQFRIVRPEAVRPNPEPSASISTTIRPDEPRDLVRRLVDFLWLPSRTQDLIARTTSPGRTAIFAVSNTQNFVGVFPNEALQPVLRAILNSGASLAMTWDGDMPARSQAFEFVLSLEGEGPRSWKDARLRCILGNSDGAVRAGTILRLGDLTPVAKVLEPFGLDRR